MVQPFCKMNKVVTGKENGSPQQMTIEQTKKIEIVNSNWDGKVTTTKYKKRYNEKHKVLSETYSHAPQFY